MNNIINEPHDIVPDYVKEVINLGFDKSETNNPIGGNYLSAKEFMYSNARELLGNLESAKVDFEYICKICDIKHPEHCTDNMKFIIRSLLNAKIKEIEIVLMNNME